MFNQTFSSTQALVLAFDYGTKRMGVAIGDTQAIAARPLCTLAVTKGLPQQAQIAQLIHTYSPVLAIIGSPKKGDATNIDIIKVQRAASRFALWLQKNWHIDVCMVDESYTSVTLPTYAHKRENKIYRNQNNDADAACQILLQWSNNPHKQMKAK